MPCSDNGPIRSASEYEYEQVKKRLDKVTRLLCTVMTEWDRDNEPIDLQATEGYIPESELPKVIGNNKELQQWWKEHQVADEKRIKQEIQDSLLKRAKAKLTKDELKAILDSKK